MSESSVNIPWPQLQAKLSLAFTDSEFDTYFKQARLAEWTGHQLTLEAADPFRREWMISQNSRITEVLREASGDRDLSVVFRTPEKEDLKSRLVVSERLVAPIPVEDRVTPLSDAFSFNNFIVGPSNRFAQ